MLVLAIICCLNIPAAKAQPGATVTMQTFYDELEPYGQWIDDPELGYVWAPDVDQSFKPYATNGHWVETEYGNTWVSDYDWGWAAFHYGRWRFDNNYGWEWIPGTEWAPAWVNWRTGGDYYGWAPLGPGIDIDVAIGSGYYAPDNYWVFVPRQYLCSPSINRYYLPPSRNVVIIRNTTIIGNVYNGGSRRYISGPLPIEIERYAGSRINVYNINNNNRPGATRIRNNTINIYRPEIAANGYGNNRPAPTRFVNRGSYDGNRTNNNYGRNNGNPNTNGRFGNSRQWGGQGNGAAQNNNPANPNYGGNSNNGYGRPARTDNPNSNNRQFPQRGETSNPNVNNNTGINNPGSVPPVAANGNTPYNPHGRQARENQALPNTNTQPAYDWRSSRNFDRNRNRAQDNQLIQQNQAQQQQMQQQREQQNQQRQQQMQQQREQQMQQNQAQQQQVQQQREQQNQQRQQQMQQQREQQMQQQNQQREQQRQQQIPPPQQQARPARQDVPERGRPERI